MGPGPVSSVFFESRQMINPIAFYQGRTGHTSGFKDHGLPYPNGRVAFPFAFGS
jgi:hypothetical protein